MKDKDGKILSILKLLTILALIQGLRIAVNKVFFLFAQETIFNSDLISLCEMTLFIVIIFFICRKAKIELSIFPSLSRRKSIGYVIATSILLILIVSTPIFNGGFKPGVVNTLIISAVATPVFEELIFRGYVWSELQQHFKSEFTVYIISTLLFALWHLGYADTVWFRLTVTGDNTGFPFIMLMKVVTGLCFGIVIGFVRYKLKNCYAAMLAHSFLNLFGR